jgi:hypothetical protein
MLRHVSQLGGMGNYTRQLMAAMLRNDDANEYVMYYKPTERLGRYLGENVTRARRPGKIEAVVGSVGDPQTSRS